MKLIIKNPMFYWSPKIILINYKKYRIEGVLCLKSFNKFIFRIIVGIIYKERGIIILNYQDYYVF